MTLQGFLARACMLLPLLMGIASARSADEPHAARDTQSDAATSLGIVVFHGYEPLDVWGPLELFASMSRVKNINLSIIGHEIGLVTTRRPARLVNASDTLPPGIRLSAQILATHDFTNAPPLDLLLVPGGFGNRDNDTAVQDFIAARYPQLKYLLGVCTGSISIARSGLLEGRRATSSKAAWTRVVTYGKNITWVPAARWVVDGNIWTSSGVAAGMDMVYAFLEHYYSDDLAAVQGMANLVEYAPHTDPHWDPFSLVHQVPGADLNGSVVDCVKPAGF